MARARVAFGVAVQVHLVILLGVPPPAGRHYFCDNLAAPPLLAGLLGHLLCNLLLLGAVEVDAAAVLAALIGTLRVQRRRVVQLVEELEELAVCDLGGVVGQLCGFGVFGFEC